MRREEEIQETEWVGGMILMLYRCDAENRT